MTTEESGRASGGAPSGRPASGGAAQPGRPSGGPARGSLTKLVQQITEIVAQGEDSGSQSQASDGGLRLRLRTVLLSLLDGIMSDASGARPCRNAT